MNWYEELGIKKPYYGDEYVCIIHGDCREILPTLPDNCVDLVLTDPPYNMGKNFENDRLRPIAFWQWYEGWTGRLQRLVREDGVLYIMANHRILAEVKLLLDRQKFSYLNTIIWAFKNGMGGSRNYSYRYEPILYYSKPTNGDAFRSYLNTKRKEAGLTLNEMNLKLGVATSGGGCASSWMGNKADNTLPTLSNYNRLKEILLLDDRFDAWLSEAVKGITFNFDDIAVAPKRWDKNIRQAGKNPSNVWVIDSLVWNSPEKEAHPTQKPIELFKIMIKASSSEGDLILDPFLGSGTTAYCAKKLNRRCIGIEIEEKYCEIAANRCRQSVMELKV